MKTITSTLSLALLAVAMTMSSSRAAGSPAPTQASPAVTEGSRVFEMRTYYAHPGKADALHKRFRDHTSTFFRKHGMDIVGYWVPVDKPDLIVYVLAYPSRAAADASWKAFREDPGWKAARAESEKDGPIVAKVESVWMNATDYSPVR